MATKKATKKVAKKAVKKTTKKTVKKAVKKAVKKTVKTVAAKKVVKKAAKKTVAKAAPAKEVEESVEVVEKTVETTEKKATKKASIKVKAKSAEEIQEAAKRVIPVMESTSGVQKIEKKSTIRSNADKRAEDTASNEVKIVGLVLKCAPQLVDEVLQGKKFLRQNFLAEVNETEERINKKKYSEVRPVEALTRVSRSKERKMDESPEELISRIARELEEEQAVRDNPYASFMCAKCNELPIADQFRIDKGFGYCEICADLLGLGQTKEAKSFEFGLGRNDSDDDDDDDDAAV